MKYLSIFAFCCLITTLTQAQPDFPIRTYGEFEIGEKVTLFGDRVNLRDQPGTHGQVITQLPVGQPLEILAIGEKSTINGLDFPWLQIRTAVEDKSLTGWLWSGLVSHLEMKGDDGVRFLAGTTGYREETMHIEIRAVKDGKILDQVAESGTGEPAHFNMLKVFDGRGISGVRHVVQFGFEYEACGYTSTEATLFWDGEHLHHVGTNSYWSDAGVGYSSETYYFPDNDDGLPDRILYEKEEGNADEVGNGEMTQVRKAYRWDGKKLVPYTYEDLMRAGN
ncbi:MAG: SH3 domain-containing protein [Saprospiraceae bacterium]|nr:SH3 domain-containing protein [Lewinella sp.]